MRAEDATLTQAQKDVGEVLCKLVLTKTSQATKTHSHASTDRILELKHTEQEWSQVAQVTVQDSDGTLAALSLQGYVGTISYGFATADGDEYSACAPLEVISQSTNSMQGSITTSFGLAGVFNFMGEDEASVAYNPESTNTDTVKTILTAIANKTMACFSHCKSYTITFDTEDALIDVFTPTDYFSVGFKESRLSAFKKALSYTRCKARIEDDGEIHVFVPTPHAEDWVASTSYSLTDKVKPTSSNLTGFEYICTTAGNSHSSEPTWPTTESSTVTETGGLVWAIVWYDYEYNDAIASTNHNFFNKSVRKRLVLPNKVVVSNHPDHSDSYTGNASDAVSYAALGNRYITEFHYTRPVSNAQCTAIATARLLGYQLAAEKGHGFAPMNVYQEVMDYVHITDSWVGDTRIGNIGFLERTYTPTKFVFEFRFGSLLVPGLAGTMPPKETTITTTTTAPTVGSLAELRAFVGELYSAYWDLANEVEANRETILQLIDYLNQGVVPKWHVTRQLIIPVET